MARQNKQRNHKDDIEKTDQTIHQSRRNLVERALIDSGEDTIIASASQDDAHSGSYGNPRKNSRTKPHQAKKRPPRSVAVNRDESPLGWLHARGHIDARQLSAGEKLRRDWEYAQLSPSIGMRWDNMPISRQRRNAPEMLEPGERQLAAKQRFDAALAHIGRDLNDIAWRVICAGENMMLAEKNMGWPARSGKLILKLALDRLADYYRIAAIDDI